ncbi:MAG: hypothetical protein ACPGJS_18900 [Flammeovirgaceae bacterium]
MAERFVKFQHFVTEEELLDFTDFLKEHGITFQVEDNTPALDINMHFNPDPLQKSFLVKIKPHDFPTVKALLNAQAEQLLDQVSQDHYLYSFSSQELFEVIKKADEWNPLDVQLAKKILAEEGIAIPEEAIEKIEQERVEELAQPKVLGLSWLIFAYVLAMLAGILAILFAGYLIHSKTTLPDGRRVYFFDEQARKHGWGIAIVSLLQIIMMAYLSFTGRLG